MKLHKHKKWKPLLLEEIYDCSDVRHYQKFCNSENASPEEHWLCQKYKSKCVHPDAPGFHVSSHVQMSIALLLLLISFSVLLYKR